MKKYVKEIESINILEVEVGTTGFCGGDRGHGCETTLKLTDLTSTSWDVRVKDRYADSKIEQPESVEITFYGDCELHTFLEALRFAVKKIEDTIEKG